MVKKLYVGLFIRMVNSMNKYICDVCGSNETYIDDYNHDYPVKNKVINITSKNRFCSKCNSIVYDDYLDNITIKKVFEEYNKSIGINSLDVIKLRHSYNLTQEQFAKIIGCAKKTLISYEKGTSIPNDIYLVTIKTLIDNPEVLGYMIDSNKDRYSENEFHQIKKRINIVEKETDEYTDLNGYINYSYNKIREMISILSDEPILKTKLLKEMFYCDFVYYKNNACSITGLEYLKYNYGPVPDNFESILEQLSEDNSILYKVEFYDNFEKHVIKSNVNNIVELNDSEKEIIYKIKNFFKDYSVKDIVNYSHNEKAFLESDMYEKISYDYSFDIEDF